MQDLLSIGRFARLAGLTIEALRHYDELSVLRPASIDPWTGYRRYRPEQLADAREVAWLRSLDLPLELVGRWRAPGTTGPERAAILRQHLGTIEARLARTGRIAHRIRTALGQKEVTMPTPTMTSLDAAERRQLAIDLFDHVWDLLAIEDRTPDQDDEMIHAVHASRYHWGEVGTTANRARGEWQCARVYAVLGRGEPALHHARRCLAICVAEGLEGWDLAAAWEAVARAAMVAGEHEMARDALASARTALATIEDPEDRAVIASDLDELMGPTSRRAAIGRIE
jgi:DNA-binding transcriptional MerR regulator